MATPLDTWKQGQISSTQHAPIQNLPLELALEIGDTLKAPEDIINFALACPGFLAYWIHLTEIIQQRGSLEDEEPDTASQLPPIKAGPLIYDPARAILFQGYSRRTIKRLFSDEIQRLIMLILFMPNPSHRIYDVEWRGTFPQLGPEYGEMLFSFKNLNKISPYCNAIQNFATDFVKKALSYDHDVAHHCFPTTAHPSLARNDELSRSAIAARDRSPVQSLDQLHETERERIMLAFYQYEATCATSAKFTGYCEIRQACDQMTAGQRAGIQGWNVKRSRQSPLAEQSMCQIERVVSVYNYVRLQYLLMFDALLAEYKDLLYESEQQVRLRSMGRVRTRNWRHHVAPMFARPEAKLEWIDVLCSRGPLFLHEVLSMDIDQRREFLLRTWYPTRVRNSYDFILEANHLGKGIFHTFNNRPALTDVNYSDRLEHASEPNLAWVELNYQAPNIVKRTNFLDERLNGLRRRGYVFWNRERLEELGLDSKGGVLRLNSLHHDTRFSFIRALDSVVQLARDVDIKNRETISDTAWWRAGRVFDIPQIPLLVEFGILGETWRIATEVDEEGHPLLCEVV